MGKGKDFLGQMFLVCRYNSIMVSAFGNGMFTLLPVFRLWSFHETDWFELFTWIIIVDNLPSESLYRFQCITSALCEFMYDILIFSSSANPQSLSLIMNSVTAVSERYLPGLWCDHLYRALSSQIHQLQYKNKRCVLKVFDSFFTHCSQINTESSDRISWHSSVFSPHCFQPVAKKSSFFKVFSRKKNVSYVHVVSCQDVFLHGSEEYTKGNPQKVHRYRPSSHTSNVCPSLPCAYDWQLQAVVVVDSDPDLSSQSPDLKHLLFS